MRPRIFKTPVPPKTTYLKTKPKADDDDDEFLFMPNAGPASCMVVCEDRETSLTPIGLLDPSGAPLYRVVVPLSYSAGFGRYNDVYDGATEIAFITTEGEWRMGQTFAGQIDDYDEEYTE